MFAFSKFLQTVYVAYVYSLFSFNCFLFFKGVGARVFNKCRNLRSLDCQTHVHEMFPYCYICRHSSVINKGPEVPYLVTFVEVPKIQKVLQYLRESKLAIWE